ncbi:MAG: DUF1579 family protein [Planctomycetota bacterium]
MRTMMTVATLAAMCVSLAGCATPRTIAVPGGTAKSQAAAASEPHKALDQFVGVWSIEGEFTPTPGAEPVRYTGRYESQSALAGHFVVMSREYGVVAEDAGRFSAFSVLGWERARGYVLTSYSTGGPATWTFASGQAPTGPDRFVLYSTHPRNLPAGAAAEASSVRVVLTIDGPDRQVHESFERQADGTERLVTRDVLTRVR